MIDLFLLSGNTTTNNADNGSLQSSSNSKTKMAALQHPAAPLSGFHPVASENNNAVAVSAALGSVTAGHGHHNQHSGVTGIKF